MSSVLTDSTNLTICSNVPFPNLNVILEHTPTNPIFITSKRHSTNTTTLITFESHDNKKFFLFFSLKSDYLEPVIPIVRVWLNGKSQSKNQLFGLSPGMFRKFLKELKRRRSLGRY